MLAVPVTVFAGANVVLFVSPSGPFALLLPTR